MVDKEARKDLATRLHQLVSGVITNDEFDERYESWENSTDAAVAEIATFGFCLYSSGIQPYRLKGRHAVADEVRETADRAILFLNTKLEYEWPTNVRGVATYWCLWGPGCYLMVGTILLFIAIAEGPCRGLLAGGVGLLTILPTIHWLFTHKERTQQMKAFTESGDLVVWPFLRRTDFQEAQRLSQRTDGG